jgi:DNA-binding LacI/PurR family transcriptional regulator
VLNLIPIHTLGSQKPAFADLCEIDIKNCSVKKSFDMIRTMKETEAKYIAIAAALRKDILSGRYETRDRFPSEEALARRFGASRPTIERALRELKREGFLDAKAGSGFYLTSFARNASGAIGVIAPDYRRIDFFTDLCDGISSVGRAAGYNVLLGDSSIIEDRASWALKTAKSYIEQKIVGVLLEPIDLTPDSTSATEAVLEVLSKRKIPVVLLDRDYLPTPERSGYDLIGIDNAQAGYRIAKHLIDNGAQTIHFLTQPDYASTIRGRIQGVAQAAFDAGIGWRKSHIVEINPDDSVAFTRIIRHIFPNVKARKKSIQNHQAFVCRNDALAARLIQALTAEGWRIPKDAMVAGFDDGKIAQLLNPPLTTISQPVNLLAETAVASLLQRIRTPDLPPRSILLDAPLTIRASTSIR